MKDILIIIMLIAFHILHCLQQLCCEGNYTKIEYKLDQKLNRGGHCEVTKVISSRLRFSLLNLQRFLQNLVLVFSQTSKQLSPYAAPLSGNSLTKFKTKIATSNFITTISYYYYFISFSFICDKIYMKGTYVYHTRLLAHIFLIILLYHQDCHIKYSVFCIYYIT